MPPDQTQDRTEPASPKRLKEAAEKGQVARSRELTTAAMLITGAGGLILMGENLIRNLSLVAQRGMVIERAAVFDPTAMIRGLATALSAALQALAPLFVLLILIALVAPLALGGWSFSPKAMAPDLSKMSPIKGLGRIFSWNGLMELVKALAKFLVVLVAAWLLMSQFIPLILGLGRESVAAGLAHTASLLGWGFLFLCASLLVVAAVDVPFQAWQHARRLRMTRQEVKDEQKETDGNPQVRGRLREMQRQIATRRMMAKVPTADVIITNPTHFAVALRYDQATMRAPIVVAKGADLIAFQIRRIGAASRVPVVSAPLLARTLYHTTDLDREIPTELYVAVAQVLAHIYQLRAEGADFRTKAIDMSDVEVPPELVGE